MNKIVDLCEECDEKMCKITQRLSWVLDEDRGCMQLEIPVSRELQVVASRRKTGEKEITNPPVVMG